MEEETIVESNVIVLGIVNESFTLGENILMNENLLDKSFTFSIGVFSYESWCNRRDSLYFVTLKLDELFWSLHIFEMSITDRGDKKGKGVAFRSINNE